MIVKTKTVPMLCVRVQNGKIIKYTRHYKLYELECDNCHNHFTRKSKQMNSRRARAGYTHVCASCDQKKFAQRMSVLRKRRAYYDASSTVPVNSVH